MRVTIKLLIAECEISRTYFNHLRDYLSVVLMCMTEDLSSPLSEKIH